MHRLLLVTFKNSFYRNDLEGSGFEITEFHPNVPDSELENLTSSVYDFAVVELNDLLARDPRGVLAGVAKKNRVLCLSNRITRDLKEMLLEHGIVDLLDGDDPGRIASYLLELLKERKAEDKIFVMDDDAASVSAIKNISARFSVETSVISSMDSLFENAGEGPRLILVNLASKMLDLNLLIRKAYSDHSIRKIPFLVYKDMKTGLFVHEFISGLNRITKYILDTPEMLGLLARLFFRRDMMPLSHRLDGLLRTGDYTRFVDGNLSQVYFNNEEILVQPDPVTNESFEEIVGVNDGLKEGLIKIDGLRWLVSYSAK
ncbi:MAG: hypothetical protein MUD12_07080 [Spirochaetes bacterium]|jgi:hypothetical protein|nr:hypothetical protein [Spirochaetota bacterium]